MKPLPETPELLAVAERVVWFKPPAEALAEPVHFLAHVMTWGTVEDLRTVVGVVGPDDFRETLENAPPGVFDARSWAYWNLKYGRQPAPPLPVRFTSSDERQTNTEMNPQCGTSPRRDAAD
jgi:hypothetical protein